MKPADRIRGETSSLLAGKRIVLGVTGSIAAVKSVELARELIRHGADVVPVMSREAARILHPNALEFATGNAVVSELTGAVEHVDLMGRGPGKADLLLVAPCTGNTLAKIALGIDDSPVTTFASTGLPTTPVVVAPAMHDTMWENVFLRARIEDLRRAGVTVLEPYIEESKAKLPAPEAIVEHVIRILGPGTLRGRRLLVVGGSTIEPIDEMRVVTNRSTGRTAVALASEAFRMGAEVDLWWGHGHTDPPPHLPIERFVTVADLVAMAPRAAAYDAVLVPAAISDFGPARAGGKIPSDRGPTLALEPLPKVVKALREHAKGLLVPFKAESGVPEADLLARARRSLAENRAPFVVANDLRAVRVDATEVVLVDAKDAERVKGTKEEVARAILGRLARSWAR